MKRAFFLGLSLLILVLGLVRPAQAQSGSCPPGSVQLTTPHGTWPDSTIVCRQYITAFATEIDIAEFEDFPCDQQLRFTKSLFSSSPKAYYVPDPSVPMGQAMRVEFWAWWLRSPNAWSPPGEGEALLHIRFYDQNRVFRYYKKIDLSDYPYITGTYTQLIYDLEFYAHFISFETAHFGTDLTEGYVEVYPEITVQPLGDSYDMYISSWKMARSSETLPEACIPPGWTSLPTATPIPTTTATPTPTPTGVYTPTATATWPVSLPTSPGGTITPPAIPTTTPIVFNTVMPENTPTPFPPLSIPTLNIPAVNFPTVDAVTIVPMAVGTITTTNTGLGDLADTINNDWTSSVNAATSGLSTTITTTTGISAPIAMINTLTQSLSVPVSYAKAIPAYMPNTSPFILWIFLIAAFVVFVVTSKFLVQAVVFVFELIRRIWEAIPLN